MNAGIDMLMSLAKLPSITRAVPITVRLVFDKATMEKASLEMDKDEEAASAASAVEEGAIDLASLTGDAKAGKNAFKRCRSCHEAKKTRNKVGPHLVGLFGRAAGSVEGFRYSKALQESGLVWDIATLDAFLAAPKATVPGTTMNYPGMKDADDRQDLLAYLASLQE